MKLSNVLGVVVMVLGAGSTVACTAFSDTYISSRENAASSDDGDGGAASSSSAATTTSGGGGSQTCTGGFEKADLTKLTACHQGKGHCIGKDRLPAAAGAVFEPCPGSSTDVCVGDEILEAGGNPLKSCNGVGPGVCVTGLLMPQLVARGGLQLPKDNCGADQLCIPCNDPTDNNKPTGMCQPIGVLAPGATCTGPTSSSDAGAAPAPALAGCCTTKGVSNGVCISEQTVPASQRDQAPQDSCAAGNKCVPKAFVENKPVVCKAGLLGQGVCMDQCFSEMMSFAGDIGILSRATCGSSELCIPCSFVSGQGVPGCQ